MGFTVRICRFCIPFHSLCMGLNGKITFPIVVRENDFLQSSRVSKKDTVVLNLSNLENWAAFRNDNKLK